MTTHPSFIATTGPAQALTFTALSTTASQSSDRSLRCKADKFARRYNVCQ